MDSKIRCRYCHKRLSNGFSKKRHESKCKHGDQYGDGDDEMETGNTDGIFYTEKQNRDMEAQKGDEEDDDGDDSGDKDSDQDDDNSTYDEDLNEEMYKSKIWQRLLREALSELDLNEVKSPKDIVYDHFDVLHRKMIEALEGYKQTWRKIKESTMYERANETIKRLENMNYGRKEAIRSGWDQRKQLVKLFVEHNMDIVDEAMKGDDDEASEDEDSKDNDDDEANEDGDENEDDEASEDGEDNENEDGEASEDGEGAQSDGEMNSENGEEQVPGLAQWNPYVNTTSALGRR